MIGILIAVAAVIITFLLKGVSPAILINLPSIFIVIVGSVGAVIASFGMDTFKKALAFPMYAAVAWLVWVLTVQVGADAVPRILGAGIVLALAAWIAGAAQRRHAVGGKPGALAAAAGALIVVAVAGGALGPA